MLEVEESVAADTIISRLFEQARKRPTAPAYYQRQAGGWQPTNFRDYVGEVKQAARALIALGFGPGHNVGVLGFNRPEWSTMVLAGQAAGGAAAGIYTTSSAAEVRYVVDHAQAQIVLVEDETQWAKLLAERAGLPTLRHVVLMKGAKPIEDELVLSWEQFLAKGDAISDREVDDRVAALQPEQLATLIYTSGTTGPPKGVMLSHHNIAWTAKVAVDLIAANNHDTALSYLPLAHIAEQTFTIYVPASTGSAIYYAESLEKVADNLKEVQPTVFFGVPRIWEKFHAGISAKLAQATGIKAKLVAWAMAQGEKAAQLRANGRQPTGLGYAIANKLIFSKLKPAVGLGGARVCVSGAAPIGREVLEFFAKLDIIVLEVYGQSEDSGPTSFNQPQRFRLGSVGPAVPGVDVKIADDGEILVRGPNVFLGYYEDEAATNETLIDGWLHSGDLGELRDGFLYITGRKKEIIITAGGKNIAPKNLEAALKHHPLINEAVVIGDRRKYLSALLTLDPDQASAWAKQRGVAVEDLPTSDELRAELQAHVDELNQEFARVEQIKKFTVLPRNLTQEQGELTPTLKVRRKQVHEHFAAEIEAMYAD
ncbi:Long-chain-fatty-acid--CoA ligase FadD15 [Enhygromyxa salina]|uniref:Long-chain-fatty-acid--CoA ligase FadD15 n=1 Tax=Enhygromyxa salina TaxID=215803 RepID=A0A2S9YN81_9BACT|nr:Long-chain-fatty-acid--CoA ligase FadD15 [Enhygromyxa salina]